MSRLANILFAIGVVVLALYVELPKYRDDPEMADLIATDPAVREAFFSAQLATATSSLDEAGAYVWGRTTSPTFSLDVHPLNPVQLYTEMKEFVWMSVTSGPWLVGFAVMQLQYADNLVVQVFRQEDGEHGTTSLKTKVTIPLLSPMLRWGSEWVPNATGSMGPSAAGHRVLYHAPPWEPTARANITFTEQDVLFDIQATLRGQLEGVASTRATIHLVGRAAKPRQFMGLSFPLGPRRSSLVNKMAAVPLTPSATSLTIDVKGSSTLPQRLELATGLLAMDYTRGLLRRHTLWHWACLSDPHSGLGLHLSSGTYDVDGVSMEATLYDASSGTTAFLNEPISFEKIDKTKGRGRWSIQSPSVSLVFTPQDGHDGRVNLKVVDVNMDHQWGTFSGTVRRPDNTVVTLSAAPGVLEDHDALW